VSLCIHPGSRRLAVFKPPLAKALQGFQWVASLSCGHVHQYVTGVVPAEMEDIGIATLRTKRAFNTMSCLWRAINIQFHDINVLRDCFVASLLAMTRRAVIASEAWRSQFLSCMPPLKTRKGLWQRGELYHAGFWQIRQSALQNVPNRKELRALLYRYTLNFLCPTNPEGH